MSICPECGTEMIRKWEMEETPSYPGGLLFGRYYDYCPECEKEVEDGGA